MAHMIPDRVADGASKGERQLFAILQKAPDNYVVYHENNSTGKYPDFIVIAPDLGLMVIEVKGWRLKEILAGDLQEVKVKQFGSEKNKTHPLRQARQYMIKLMKRCEQHPDVESLLQTEGRWKNHFIFPFGHFAILSWITTEQLKSHPNGDFTAIFPPNKVVPKERFTSWLDESFTTEDIVETLSSFFDPKWNFEPLTEEQIDKLRGIIHPEIVIPSKPATLAQQLASKSNKSISIKQLDLKQEENARNIGRGHRIIYGVAGSGKTIILIARAKFVSSKYPESKILLLCYNVVLSAYLKKVLEGYQNVSVKHFDEWSKENGKVRKVNKIDGYWESESDEELGARLQLALENGAKDCRKYDTVMVDEAQDFHSLWFSCILEAMKDPCDGDLIIVGDGSQGLYPRGKVSWKQIGINAQGRTIHKRFDLDKNYRNSREIIEVAAIFANSTLDEDEDCIKSPIVNPNKTIRETGIKPVYLQAKSREEECFRVIEIVKDLLAGKWFEQSIEKIAPENIGILYPYAGKYGKPILKDFLENLNLVVPTVWLSETQDSRNKVCESGVKVQTIHSAKGIQYRAVIILWTGLLPTNFQNSDEEQDRRLLYVALTRAEDFLLISNHKNSKFVNQILESNKVMITS